MSVNVKTEDGWVKVAGNAKNANVINNLGSMSATDALSANMGRALNAQISAINTIQDLEWYPYCPTESIADKVHISEAFAQQYGKIVKCSVVITIDDTVGGYMPVASLPKAISMAYSNIMSCATSAGPRALYLTNNTLNFRDPFPAGAYYLEFMYFTNY